MKGAKKSYERGDQIHFIVTEDFVKTINDFVSHCKSNSINPSEAMRSAIAEWLQSKQMKERKLQQLVHGTASFESIAEEYERNVLREV